MSTKFEANDIDMLIEDSGRLHYGRRRDGMVVELDGKIYWDNISQICPVPKYVLDNITYGDQVGILGKINTDNADISTELADNILFEIQNLYPSLKNLDYLEDVSKNSFRGNEDRVGVRELSLSSTGELVGRETVDRTFEIVLTTDYVNKKGSDANQRISKQELIARMELIRRKLRITKGGSYRNVRITRDFNEPEVEYISPEKTAVVVCRAEITINYRVNNA